MVHQFSLGWMLFLAVWEVTCVCNACLGQVSMSAIVTTLDRQNYRGEIALKAGEEVLCRAKYSGSDKEQSLGTIKFTPTMKTLTMEGSIIWKKSFFGSVGAKGSCFNEFLDLTPLMQPLRDESSPWHQRAKRFIAAQRAYPADHPLVGDSEYLLVELEDQASDSELNDAEKRLGYALPSEHRELLKQAGRLVMEDSFMTKASDFQTAFVQMRDQWETPESSLARLPADVKKLLESSTILYTQVGDGYAALLYQPPLESQDAASSRKSARYYWISQDEIVRPRLLANRDGSLKNYSQMMLWLLASEAVHRYEDEAGDVVCVDFSSPGPQHYRLDCFPMKPLTCRLSLDWEQFE